VPINGPGGPELTPPPAWQGGLPSTGTRKVLVLLIDFPDMPTPTPDTVADIQKQVLRRRRTASKYPYESLRKLLPAGLHTSSSPSRATCWAGIGAAQNRADVPQTTAGRQALINAALSYYDSQGHDFTQYDNDGNGTIDVFYVKWPRPRQRLGQLLVGLPDVLERDHTLRQQEARPLHLVLDLEPGLRRQYHLPGPRGHPRDRPRPGPARPL